MHAVARGIQIQPNDKDHDEDLGTPCLQRLQLSGNRVENKTWDEDTEQDQEQHLHDLV
jgi:hypothetical protein